MGKYFGTDGFRGEANVGLTSDQAYKVGRFLGWYYGELKRRNGDDTPARIVIGKDTRRSSYMFEYTLVGGLVASGADAYLLHVTTTPSVAYVARTDGFDCGITLIDEWLSTRSRSAEKQGTAVAYVTYAESGELAGFYSLSAHAMERSNIAGGWLQRNVPERVPMILLGMLGVDRRFQGEGLGRKLLHDTVIRSLNISSELGARALIVDPVDSAAARFYENNGFQHIPESERMFLKLAGKHLV